MTFLRKHWQVGLKLLATILLFWLLFRHFGGPGTLHALREADIALFGAACLLMVAAMACNGIRWLWVSQATGHPITPMTMTLGTAEAAFFNQVLPTGVGGDAMRVIRACHQGITVGWAIIGVTIDRAIGVLAIAVALLALLLLQPDLFRGGEVFLLLTGLAGLIAAGAVAAVLIGMLPLSRWLPRWFDHLVFLVEQYSIAMRQARFLARMTAIMIASTVLYTWSFVLCAEAIGISLGWDQLFVIILGLALSALVPVSIGGWGVREGAAIALFAPYGVAAEQALAASILLGLVLTVIGIIGGIVWIVVGYKRIDTPPPPSQ